MSSVPTPHNAAQRGQIAKTVLMPGDPLRAKVVAERYLEDVRQFNSVRNMLGYTGVYQGREVSVMGSGMGMPSIGIYAHELYSFYDVDVIIRIGSAGGLDERTRLRDLVIAQGACTDSNFAAMYHLPGTFAPIADYGLLSTAVRIAAEKGVRTLVGNILSSDHFYHAAADADASAKWQGMGVLAIEMESAALYMIAAELKKRALGIFTVSDLIHTEGALSAGEREESFDDMMQVALATATCI
ncbi:MAG TPA: purine-nucleoside phosphorylase [Atopobiaceae bacterium]|nr:purine-nucleoside phosphorylase [Atopobiaceae bacterium]